MKNAFQKHKGKRSPNYSLSLWPSSSLDYDRGVPMDIDAVLPFGTANVECYNCHEKGHFSKNCPHPQKPRGQASRGRGSFRGHHYGHGHHHHRSSSSRQNTGPPQNNNRNQQSRGRGKPQHNGQKRKMNASQFKTHIRTLIEENFSDTEGPEFNEFLENIQEGF